MSERVYFSTVMTVAGPRGKSSFTGSERTEICKTLTPLWEKKRLGNFFAQESSL